MTSDGTIRRFARWCWADIRTGETLDLWLLLAAAFVFTILGASGTASVQTLSSVVLGLLALLAISQLRGRQEVRRIMASWQRGRAEMLEADFPEAYYQARRRASRSFRYAGLTMSRTLPTVRPDLVRILKNHGTVQILLPDPDNAILMEMVAASRPYSPTASETATIIRQSITLAKSVPGAAEVRITSVLPRIGLNIVDAEEPNALVMVQLYQFQPAAEPGPIFVLTPADGPWCAHFQQEFERLWCQAKVA